MHTILLILVLVVIYYGGQLIPDDMKERWENSEAWKWVYPISVVVATVLVAFGIGYDVLKWQAVFFPILLGAPYILGMVSGIWKNMKEAGKKTVEKGDARDCVIKSLRELGCQPKVENDNSIIVRYQGEIFKIECGKYYIFIYDPFWIGINADHPDVPLIKEAINQINYNFGPRVVYSSVEGGKIGITSLREFVVYPGWKETTPMLKEMLDSFFPIHKGLVEGVSILRAEARSNEENQVIAGFSRN